MKTLKQFLAAHIVRVVKAAQGTRAIKTLQNVRAYYPARGIMCEEILRGECQPDQAPGLAIETRRRTGGLF